MRFEGRSITYAELNRGATRLADALRARGIRTGERVALFLPNAPEFLTVYYAVQKLGAMCRDQRDLQDRGGALPAG